MKDAPQLLVTSRAEWRAWLAEHHACDSGIWLVTYKKASGKPRVSYDEIVEEALCFGWIDSRPGTIDEERTKLWLAPRKRGSGWSRINKNRVERLVAAGLVESSGLRVIETAKADGSWSVLDDVEDGIDPDDLAEALAAMPPASSEWNSFQRILTQGNLAVDRGCEAARDAREASCGDGRARLPRAESQPVAPPGLTASNQHRGRFVTAPTRPVRRDVAPGSYRYQWLAVTSHSIRPRCRLRFPGLAARR